MPPKKIDLERRKKEELQERLDLLRIGQKQSISWKLQEVENRLSDLDEVLFQMDRPKVKTLKEALRRANDYLDQLLVDVKERQKEMSQRTIEEILSRRAEKELD